MNAAYLAARRSGMQAFPMLDVAWVGLHGLDLGTSRYAPQEVALSSGGSLGLVPPGGFAPINYGTDVKDNVLRAVTTTVRVADLDRVLAKRLESYDPRGSAARIRWVVPELVEGDWETIFTGVVFDWKVTGGVFLDLILRTDDSLLQSTCPRPVFNKSEWGTAADGSIFNTAMPAGFGYFSNFAITGRGMLPAIDIRYDELLGFWWIASIGNFSVERVYIDAVLLEPEDWSLVRGVFGGAFMTVIVLDPALKPNRNAVMTFDGTGPSEAGALDAVMANPVRQLRSFLEQYVFRNTPASVWDTTPIPIIDAASWDAMATYFDAFQYESAVRIGGDRDKPTAATVIQSFLDSYRWIRMAWLPSGALAIGRLNHDDDDPNDDWLRADVLTAPDQFVYEPGDRREVFSHLSQPYMWSPSEQKFMATLECHDIAATPEPVWATVENRWSQGRFTNT
jgi:hypothetical protein